MDLETVRYSTDDGIARITLDRPERHNAINGPLLRDRDCAAVPAAGAMHSKEALNTALDILGVGALFRYHGQMNALDRLDP